MNSPTASRSRWYSWNSATFSPSTIREWPVPDGIDEHQVALGEQRVLVVDERIRRRRRIAHVVGGHALRSEDAEVKPHAARAGAAVETEDHRPRLRLLDALQRVGDEEERGPRLVARAFAVVVGGLFAVVAKHHRAAGGGVGELLPADDDAVLGDDDAFLRLLWRGRRGGDFLGLGHVGHFPGGLEIRRDGGGLRTACNDKLCCRLV